MDQSGRGQSDVDRLLVFVVGVTAVLVVVPTVFGLAGVDIKDISLGDGDGQDDGPLVVLATYGTGIDDERSSVGSLEVLVTATDEGVDLTQLTVSWSNGEDYQLTPAGTSVGDASYSVTIVGGNTTLAGPDSRALLRFDPGTDDVATAGSFGERLEPGDSIQLTFTTDDGRTTRVTVTVPSPLPDRPAARFR